MEMKQIKELMAAMEKAGIKRLRIKEKQDYEIELERKEEAAPAPAPAPVIYHPHPEPHRFPAAGRHHHEEPSNKVIEEKKSEAPGKHITSPMVGTMYAAASPEDAPFVKVGDKVDENTVVCIIEAMKVMNEVKAGMSGTIAEVLVQNAHPVEFGTKLFRIT